MVGHASAAGRILLRVFDRLRRRLSVSPGSPAGRTRERTSGRPPSANGASSLHLRWDLADRYDEVAVTLEVVDRPQVDALYFWALQVDIADEAGRTVAGGHAGLQWHPHHPGRTAVNWGGYLTGGGELEGSPSPLPSATANPNTRDLAWSAGVPLRLAVGPGDQRAAPVGQTAWRASVVEPTSGRTTVVRDLWTPPGAITGVLVWSEVFARCDDPPVEVRWTDPSASAGRASQRPRRATVNYQAHRDGGCSNTASWSAPDGLHQRTNTSRRTPQGTVLEWP